MLGLWLAMTLIAASAFVALPASARPAQRIVSLNLCADQILIDLVARDRIAAVSHLAADPTVSAVAEKAKGIAVTRGEAESVLAFDPDLVLAGAYSTPATVSILERIGRRVVKMGLAGNLDEIKNAVATVAAAVDETERGAALVAALEKQLGDARHRPGAPRPSALVYQVNGLSAGTGSLADAVLAWAGFRNHATDLGLGSGGQVALESLVADPPDLIVLTGPEDEYRTAVAENLRHPALAAAIRRKRVVVVPWRYWLCGTPHVAEAVTRLTREREALAGGVGAPKQ